jgi:hypothetical protein
MFVILPDEINRNIMCRLPLIDQINCSLSSKYLYSLNRLKNGLYKQEYFRLVEYIQKMGRRFNPRHLETAMCIVFKQGNFKIKITIHEYYKLKFMYKMENDNGVTETISNSFYFERIIELKMFLKSRILRCNMYSNTMLFTPRYHFTKVY